MFSPYLYQKAVENMNHLEETYVNLAFGYTQDTMLAGKRKSPSAEYLSVDNILEEKVFPAMLEDGGTKTERGVEYKGFEYRLLQDPYMTSGYFKNVILPKLDTLYLRGTEAVPQISIEKITETFETFADHGYLASMDDRRLMKNMPEILQKYEAHISDKCPLDYDMDDLLDFLVNEYEDIKESFENITSGKVYEDFDFKEDVFNISFEANDELKARFDKVMDARQVYICLEDGTKMYLPAVQLEDKIMTFDEVADFLAIGENLTVSIDYAKSYDPEYFYDPDRRTNYLMGYSANEGNCTFESELPDFTFFEYDKRLQGKEIETEEHEKEIK